MKQRLWLFTHTLPSRNATQLGEAARTNHASDLGVSSVRPQNIIAGDLDLEPWCRMCLVCVSKNQRLELDWVMPTFTCPHLWCSDQPFHDRVVLRQPRRAATHLSHTIHRDRSSGLLISCHLFSPRLATLRQRRRWVDDLMSETAAAAIQEGGRPGVSCVRLNWTNIHFGYLLAP